jgi:putative FmdB family regulatory protein
MPLYDMRCAACSWAGEVEHKLAESIPPCPVCGKNELGQVFSRPRVFVIKDGNAGKVFYSEREVEAKYGRDWRETKHSRTEGGCGQVQYYHRRSR